MNDDDLKKAGFRPRLVLKTPESRERALFVKGAKRRVGSGEHPTRSLPLRLKLDITKALSETELRIRDAAHHAMNGESLGFYPELAEPNNIEEKYLRAISAFQHRKMVRGMDLLDSADKSALLRYGRGKLRR